MGPGTLWHILFREGALFGTERRENLIGMDKFVVRAEPPLERRIVEGWRQDNHPSVWGSFGLHGEQFQD